MELGIATCNQSQIIGVLVYNALRQMAITQRVGILESLCDTLGFKVSCGSRPTENFFSHYAAFQGGRLVYDKVNRRPSFKSQIFKIRGWMLITSPPLLV